MTSRTKMNCAFCGRSSDDIVHGPPGVTICEACLRPEVHAAPAAGVEATTRCSFCNQVERRSRFAFRRRLIVYVSPGGDVRICSSCVVIARDVVEHERKRRARSG